MNIGGFLQNDSAFGRLMTKCGTIIALNVLFVISCVPFFTIGAAGTGMYYAVFEMLKLDTEGMKGDAINPFKVYWTGFRKNFIRATICWVAFVGIMMLGGINLQVCAQWTGWLKNMSVGVIAVMILAVVITVYMLPVLTMFSGKLTELIKLSVSVAISHPLKMILILFLNVTPAVLLYLDEINRPTYVFIGAFFGFGLIAYIVGKILLSQFEPYLGMSKAESI
ncbi:MAG: DUF624 domain-containing protein [Eubacterium sp.]|nr:DUF624 domain-containing protein [Eubacterium sp.]